MLFRFLIIGFFSGGLAVAQQSESAVTHDFPAAELRGFGTVSGSQVASTIDGQAGSVLTITCENEDKAKLVLAKFLSDEQTLPGVTKQSVKVGQWGISMLRFGGTPVTAWQVEDQGWLTAVRVGSKVYIAAALNSDGLVKQIDGALNGVTDKPIAEAEVQVPMWLDRWDQHGFRFYYSPWGDTAGRRPRCL